MFDIHGDLEMESDKNIIIVTLRGSFNEAGVNNWTQKLKQKVKKFNDKPFFILMNNSNYEGFTPEAFDISNKFNLWLNEQSMVLKAVVQPSTLARDINLKNIPALADQRIEYFNKSTDAISYLKKFPEYLSYAE